MFSKLKGTLHQINKAAGVEITLLPDNQYSLRLVVLSLKKNVITVEKKEQLEKGNIETLSTILDKDVPIFLVVSGRGILHKKILEAGEADTNLIQLVLPNAKTQDFYCQNCSTEKSSLISIVRKEVVDPILEKFNNANLPCIGMSLGGSSISVLKSIIKEVDSVLEFSWAEHKVEFDSNGSVIDYKALSIADERNYFQVDTEKVEKEFLLSYAGAFSVLLGLEPQPPFVESIQLVKEEYLNKQLFKKVSWAALLLFLIVLMVNFISYSSFSSENNVLVQKESKYSTLFLDMENLTKEVKEKETFLSEAGWLESSSSTYYADRIAASIPNSVKLTELSINPMDERKSKEEKKELFTSGLIVVMGNCTRPTELNEWLDKIKSIDKITKAKLVNYAYDNKENKGSFRIEIETEN